MAMRFISLILPIPALFAIAFASAAAVPNFFATLRKLELSHQIGPRLATPSQPVQLTRAQLETRIR